MPINRHQDPIEIKDFTAGLWEGSDWLMPPQAFQEMTNCHPEVGGGLRAFHKASAISNTGLVDPTNERVIGLFARGVQHRTSDGMSTDRYLLTYHTGGAGAYRPRLYRMDGSNSETTWTQIYKTSGTTLFNAAVSDGNSPLRASFAYFRTSAGVDYVIMTVDYFGTQPGGTGMYQLAYADLSSSQKAVEVTSAASGLTYPSGALAIHQARVVAGSGNDGAIVWSDPGTLTFTSDNYLFVERSQLMPKVFGLVPQPPSALVVVKEGAPFVAIHGDIEAPTVYELARGVTLSGTGYQIPGVTPDGMTVISSDGHVYLTGGESLVDISESINDLGGVGDAVAVGDTNYAGNFLFAPRGYVRHWPTGAWFKQTQMAGYFHNVDRLTNDIWGPVAGGTSPSFVTMSTDASASRTNTFSVKTAPLRTQDGRRLEIREVEVVCKAYDTSAVIAITVGGVTRTITMAATGTQKVSGQFIAAGEVLDVRVVSTAGNAANEAPSIEVIRVWPRSGHLSY